jgi:hypothetical protein
MFWIFSEPHLSQIRQSENRYCVSEYVAHTLMFLQNIPNDKTHPEISTDNRQIRGSFAEVQPKISTLQVTDLHNN